MNHRFRQSLLRGVLLGALMALPQISVATEPLEGSCLNSLQAVGHLDRLRLTLSSSETIEGRFFSLQGDTLGIVPVSITPRDINPLTRKLAASDIVRVEVWNSGTGQGAKWGATSGAVIGGALAGLLGWALSGLESDGSSSSSGELILPAVAVGALAGAVVIGGLGAGIGALSSEWTVLYPRAPASGTPNFGPARHATRWVLHGGLAQQPDHQGNNPVWGARLAVMKRLGSKVAFGPAVGYYHFDQERMTVTPWAVYTTSTDPVATVGLDLALDPAKTGISPYGLVSAGWYVSGDLYVGGMVGAGVRWQPTSGPAYHLDARYHRSLTGDVSGGVDRFWIFGGGITFGL